MRDPELHPQASRDSAPPPQSPLVQPAGHRSGEGAQSALDQLQRDPMRQLRERAPTHQE